MPRNIAEFDRNAVITIQGGGVYALSLLGQLEGLVKDGKIIPLALAGTSAGAIVATLFWSKLNPINERPAQIRDEISKLCPLTYLLGEFEPSPPETPFDFKEFRRLKKKIETSVEMAKSHLAPGGKAAAKKPGFFKKLWNGGAAFAQLEELKNDLAPHVKNRGFFLGERLEEEVERLLRQSPDVADLVAELKLPKWPHGKVRFSHFHDLAKKDVDRSFRPPLFLVATNLTAKKVEVFTSLDPNCNGISVAEAVRASAGFPVFFRPLKVAGGPTPGWYVDGGVVSNFPSWVFTQEFRRSMRASDIFQGLAMRPWMHIGLRVEDDEALQVSDLEDPNKFLQALLSMLAGQARNELDEKLSAQVSRSVIIRQPKSQTDGPPSVLDFDEMKSEKVTAMYVRGSEYAERSLKPLTFKLPENTKDVQAEEAILSHLRRLVSQAEIVVGNSESLRFRSNIFIPSQNRLSICYSVNMEGDPDENMIFESTVAGLTGACYTQRCPLICNLEEVGKLAREGTLSTSELFNMPPELHEMVKEDRTWLASVPIFDPFDSAFGAQARPPIQAVSGQYYYQYTTIIDGAVLGVLNLDSNWSYRGIGMDHRPIGHYKDTRIVTILDLMQQAALRLGHLFGSAFGART